MPTRPTTKQTRPAPSLPAVRLSGTSSVPEKSERPSLWPRRRIALRYCPAMASSLLASPSMECWLITSRAEVMRLEFGEEPPAEICLPDKPLSEIADNTVLKAIQQDPYLVYRRYHLAHESC